MRITDQIILREIAGEHVLIPIGQTALRIHGMITVTESGYLMIRKLQDGASADELKDLILSEYEVDETTARQDVITFLSKLDKLGLLDKECNNE